MTAIDRQKIVTLQGQGLGYKRIAAQLGLPLNTVKSFCRRHPALPENGTCPNCGKVLEQTSGHRQKRFCSDVCRMAWWRAHPDLLNRRAYYDFICAFCGQPFQSYGNAKRKYCCRSCYDKARSGRTPA